MAAAAAANGSRQSGLPAHKERNDDDEQETLCVCEHADCCGLERKKFIGFTRQIESSCEHETSNADEKRFPSFQFSFVFAPETLCRKRMRTKLHEVARTKASAHYHFSAPQSTSFWCWLN